MQELWTYPCNINAALLRSRLQHACQENSQRGARLLFIHWQFAISIPYLLLFNISVMN